MLMDSLVWVDYALITVVVLSALVSLFRGFVKEALSLAGWIASFLLATRFAESVAVSLSGWVEHEQARQVLAYAAVFVAVLVLWAIISRLIVKLIRASALSGLDRVVGVFFGLLRGLVLVAVLVLLGSMSPLAEDPLWNDSIVIAWVQEFTDRAVDYMQMDVPGKGLDV